MILTSCHRALEVVAQIMDLDLEKESNTHLTETLFQQDKQDGSGGCEVIKETPEDLRIHSEIQEFYV